MIQPEEQGAPVSNEVRIGDKVVGAGHACYVVAEIGINHNGDIDIAKKLIAAAAFAGCDAVKFQKRTPELCIPVNERSIMRETPWGYLRYLEYRNRIEFGFQEYQTIDPHTAVGIAVAEKEPRDPAIPMVVLSTAHAAKFPDAVAAASGVRPALPEWLSDLDKRPERVTVLPVDQSAVERFVLSTSRAAQEGAAA